VLGLELEAGEDRVLFYMGNALLLEASELLEGVQRRVDLEIQLRQQEAQLRQQEAQLRQEAEARVTALEAELAALKKPAS
jgi:hypothetical protein